jgi:hypothetical protein
MNRRSFASALASTLLLAAALTARPALSHHSFAAVYQSEESVTVEGKVVQFQYRNPHSVLHVLATDASGAEKRWAIEWQGASQLAAAGISPQTVRPGDAVIVTGHPGRIAAENRILMLEIKRSTDDFSWKNNGSLN